ncbi:MAG TPA: formyltetrahydrofolate deformylase [Caulobacterales bacterium]|nr:formyltetrahydrofolate deformylase [Caulobacterales bacterium]
MIESGCILTIVCPDRKGIVAAVSRFLFERDCNIVESTQFGDRETNKFFLRILFSAGELATIETLRREFAPIASSFAMSASFHAEAARTRTLIMVSRLGHCLVDLLYRWRIGALPIDIAGVVSNHRDFADVAAAHGTPFHYLPIDKTSKARQEDALSAIVDAEGVELIVLARYMQILSPAFCGRMRGRVINIHHSFLPSFKGARPYHQAHERGVKLIGATAHYVTEDLDEGPIIEQGAERVTHAMSPADLAAIGRDVETVVLARAVRWHAEHRVLLNGKRTVVLA